MEYLIFKTKRNDVDNIKTFNITVYKIYMYVSPIPKRLETIKFHKIRYSGNES